MNIKFQENTRERSVKAAAETLARKQEIMKKSLTMSACIVLVLLRDAAGVPVTREVTKNEGVMLEALVLSFKTAPRTAILNTKTYGQVKLSPVE